MAYFRGFPKSEAKDTMSFYSTNTRLVCTLPLSTDCLPQLECKHHEDWSCYTCVFPAVFLASGTVLGAQKVFRKNMSAEWLSGAGRVGLASQFRAPSPAPSCQGPVLVLPPPHCGSGSRSPWSLGLCFPFVKYVSHFRKNLTHQQH